MMNSGIVVNRRLLPLAKLSETAFLTRVANVQAIRTKTIRVSLFISSARQMAQLEELHAAVHSEKFTAKITGFELSPSWVPFVLDMPPLLHQWLATYSLNEIKAQLINWMAALYAAYCRRDAMWRKLLPDIKLWAGAYYTPYAARQADELLAQWTQQFNQARRFAGGRDCGILNNPFADNERPFLDNEAVANSFLFPVRVGYFREDDWLFIVERNRQKLLDFYQSNLASGSWTEHTIDQQMRNIDADQMLRSEAKEDLWQAWKSHFSSAVTEPDYHS